MRWNGETYEQKTNRLTEEWTVCFALLPKQMHDGGWIWLEQYENLAVHQRGSYYRPPYRRMIGDTWNDPLEMGRPPSPSPMKSSGKPPAPPKPPPLRYIKEGGSFGEFDPPRGCDT